MGDIKDVAPETQGFDTKQNDARAKDAMQITPAPVAEQKKREQTPLQMFFDREDVLQKFQKVVGKKYNAFVTTVLSIVSKDDKLKNADCMSIFNAAMTAATMDLPVNPNLGFAYILPYNTNVAPRGATPIRKSIATFQMGYKGYIQLAQRSGQYKTISSSPVYEGQLVEKNPLTGYKFDWTVEPKEGAKPIGYVAYFQLMNGFEKTFYMTSQEVLEHGKAYSKNFKDYGTGLRKDKFEAMALKTVTKLLLSKFGILSLDMQRAIISDDGVIKDVSTMDVEYVDNPEKDINDVIDTGDFEPIEGN